MKRILSLDGGGIRGHFTIQVLREVERRLRQRTGNAKLHLCDHFDLIAGTSTGAVIGSLLAWGKSVDEIDQLYRKHSKEIFKERDFLNPEEGTFHQDPLESILQDLFREQDGSPAGLGTSRLPWRDGRYLMMVAMERETLSPWVLTNNPHAPVNSSKRHDSHLHVPLWKVVCASAAVPPYFRSQEVELDRSKQPIAFLDGGLSGYNNPAALAFRMATLPRFGLEWTMNPDELFLLSIGTSDPETYRVAEDAPWMGNLVPRALQRALVKHLEIVKNMNRAVDAIIASSTVDQDIVCRSMARTLFGHRINADILTMGALDKPPLDPEEEDLDVPPRGPDPRLFAYTRYQKTFSREELEKYKKDDITFWITDLHSQDALIEIGQAYATSYVKDEHLL